MQQKDLDLELRIDFHALWTSNQELDGLELNEYRLETS